MNELVALTVGRVFVGQAPSDGTEPVRRMDLLTLLESLGLPAHAHAAGEVTGLAAAVRAATEAWLVAGGGVEFVAGDGTRTLVVRVAPEGPLAVTEAGLAVQLGAGAQQAAPGDHSHDQLHDPLSVAATTTVELQLSGQQLTGAVRLAPGGGLVVGEAGLALDFGDAHGQAARGDHEHGPAAEVLEGGDTPTAAVNIEAGVVRASVRLDAAPASGIPIAAGEDGLSVPAGTGAEQAARGNHSHSLATEEAPGFLAAADYSLLRQLSALGLGSVPATEFVVGWSAGVQPEAEGLLPGWRQWGAAIQATVVRAQALAMGAPEPTVLELLWAGVATGITLTLPAGAMGVSVEASVTLSELVVPPGARLAWRVVSHSATSGLRHTALDVALHYRMSPHPGWRINLGGPALYPYLAHQLLAAGSNLITAEAIDRSGVAEAAPEAIYQTARARTDGGVFTLVLTGLAPEHEYTLRLHWADLGTGGAAGVCVMAVSATGATVATIASLDVFAVAPGTFRACVRELTLRPDAAGEILLSLAPHGATQNVFLSAVEVLP